MCLWVSGKPRQTMNSNPPIVQSDRPVALVGGAPVVADDLALAGAFADLWVAADGGADTLHRAGITPSAVIGDMDSLSALARAAFADCLHPIAEQDSTDFDKALRHINAPLVIGVGFSGARLDHELAAMNVLVRRAEQPCILLGAETLVFHCPPKIALNLPVGSDLSLFPMARLRCASTGLHWATGGVSFAPDGMIGTSNRVAGPVTLHPDSAGMLVILPRAALAVVVAALMPA